MLDTSRLPVGERGWRRLLDHAVTEGDKIEAHYLEIKGPLDLDDGAHRAKVAKFLLGAANRNPELAARHYEGHAILVIGVGEGEAEGVPAGTEPHNLENSLRKYVGEDFPGFEMTRLSVEEDREVLFIVAFPPRDGDPIYPCHASLEDEKSLKKTKPYLLARSAIYIRPSSETRQATPDDIKMLSRRAQNAGRRAVELQLSHLGPIHRLFDLEETITALYDAEEKGYRRKHLGESQQPALQAISSPALLGFNKAFGMGQSTPAQREKRLQKWLHERAESEAAAREQFLSTLMQGFTFEVVSPGRSIDEPRLELRLHQCEVVEFLEDDEPTWRDFVEPVHEYVDPLALPAHVWIPRRVTPRDHPITWEQDGNDVLVLMQLDSLRPDSLWRADSDDFVVMARDPEAQAVTLSWRLTERGSDDQWTGEQEVATEAPRNALEVFKDRVLSKSGE